MLCHYVSFGSAGLGVYAFRVASAASAQLQLLLHPLPGEAGGATIGDVLGTIDLSWVGKALRLQRKSTIDWMDS